MQPVHLNDVTPRTSCARPRGIAARVASSWRRIWPATLPLVGGDKVHLQQILLNLILNGMDAMAKTPSKKRLTAGQIVCDGARLQNAWVEIAVAGTGAGIAPCSLPRLFEPFSDEKGRDGPGLSIARTLVECIKRPHLGDNVRGGATFRFTVPVSALSQVPIDAPKATLELTA